MLTYLILFFVLLMAQILYMKVGENHNILDYPNKRSSHVKAVVRGGGIVIYLSILACLVVTSPEYYMFYLGVTLIAGVGFLDDLFSVSRILRLFIHLLAICCLYYSFNFDFSPVMLIGTLVVAIGMVNAYNFMDGINGISGIYSIVFFLSIYYINHYIISFVEEPLIIFPLIAVIVFGIFNFREKARLFMGDVGSTTLAFLSIFVLGLLLLKTYDWSFIFLVTVFGLDSGFTILVRILRKENILEAHRSHLYQFMANEMGIRHVPISLLYGCFQLIINVLVIINYTTWQLSFFHFAVFVLVPSMVIYWLGRYMVYLQLSSSKHV